MEGVIPAFASQVYVGRVWSWLTIVSRYATTCRETKSAVCLIFDSQITYLGSLGTAEWKARRLKWAVRNPRSTTIWKGKLDVIFTWGACHALPIHARLLLARFPCGRVTTYIQKFLVCTVIVQSVLSYVVQRKNSALV